MTTRPLILLGPQRFAPNVGTAMQPFLGPDTSVAVVTAGWEEREAEDVELSAHLACTLHNLALHRRLEDVLARDPELFEALRARRDTLLELQKLYRLQLRHLGRSAEELLRRKGPNELLEPERDAAVQHLRALDDHRLERIDEVNASFRARWQPSARSSIAVHREELRSLLADSTVLCVAGGHVGSLFNSLWLFDVPDLLPAHMPIVAWSAGAMVLADRIVLFHDSPPQGRGYAEVWGPGFGLAPNIVPLPHASRRLRLEDPSRVQLLSRRFPEALCAVLDPGSHLVFVDGVWSAASATQQLNRAGLQVPVGGR